MMRLHILKAGFPRRVPKSSGGSGGEYQRALEEAAASATHHWISSAAWASNDRNCDPQRMDDIDELSHFVFAAGDDRGIASITAI
ncbi:MAG: hypothetical protein ACKVVP_05640 [Chloroflexota bacterium]